MSFRDRLQAKKQAIADRQSGQQRSYKFLNGKTYFRILPGVSDPAEFFTEIGIHWIKDPSSGKVVTAIGDRSICFGEACPVRDAINELSRKAHQAGDEEGVKFAKDMMAKPRNFVNAVIVKAPGEFDPSKPVLVEFSEKQFDAILSQIEEFLDDIPEDADPSKVGPLSLKEGALFCIERSGHGLETRYNIYLTGKSKAVEQSVFEQATDLESFKRAQFGERQNKALSHLSQLLGRDLTEAEAGLLTGSPSSAGQIGMDNSARSSGSASGDTQSDSDDSPFVEDEDAKQENVENTTTEAVSEEDLDADFLAELDNL